MPGVTVRVLLFSHLHGTKYRLRRARELNPVQTPVITARPKSAGSLNLPTSTGLAVIKAKRPLSGAGSQSLRTVTGATIAAPFRVRCREFLPVTRPISAVRMLRFSRRGRQCPDDGSARSVAATQNFGIFDVRGNRIRLFPDLLRPHDLAPQGAGSQGVRAETGSPRISTSATLCLRLRHLPALVSDGYPGPRRSSGTGSENGRCP